MPATVTLTANGTSRPSTNDSDAASSQTAAGAANGKRRRAEQRQHDEGDRRDGEPERGARRRSASCLIATSSGALERREHDQDVESVSARSDLSRLTG